MQDRLRDLRLALGFLSRLPLGGAADMRPLAEASGMFGVAGAILGLCGAAAAWLAIGLGAGPFVAALIGLAVLAVVSGALHEDGFADVMDALGARGGPEARLAVMRDSRIGSYGALALMFLVLLKAGALAEALGHGPRGALLLLGAAAVSRAVIPWAMERLPLARAEGLAAWAGAPPRGATVLALVTAAAIALLGAVLAGLPEAGLLGLLGAAGGAFLMVRLARRAFGGYTGDVLGAVQQAAELGFLLLASTAL